MGLFSGSVSDVACFRRIVVARSPTLAWRMSMPTQQAIKAHFVMSASAASVRTSGLLQHDAFDQTVNGLLQTDGQPQAVADP